MNVARAGEGRSRCSNPAMIHARADEWHFHGGTASTPLVHVAVNGGSAPEWGEPVSDEEFAEGL